jgi:metal-responsive CopG/Arc/MetJ family transcriptional regulator
MKVLTAHIPLELAGEVDALADRLDRSRAWIVKQALEDYIGRQARPGGFAEAPARFGVPDVTTQQGEIDMNARDHSRQEGMKTQAAAAHATLLALRAITTLGDISWAELRDAGRA